ncbi:MAG: hypothetical protein LBN27_03715 [Prevotellaceae bacterium]|jgi:low affinity Fe/Cu permease|nr:hypothetical protein [Prevotellaceae bacterium]
MEKNLGLGEAVKQYLGLKWEYYRLSFIEKVAMLIGTVILMVFMAILALVLILLLTFFGYGVLMSLIGITWLVVLIEIAVVLLMMGLLWKFRDTLVIQPVGNMIIRALFDDDSKQKENGKI